MNTFNDDNELGFFEEPRRRPPRDRARRPQRSGPRRPGPPPASNNVLRLGGLVAIAIAIIVGFVLWVGSCSGRSKGDYSAYISAMKPLAQESASVGQQFATALGTPNLTMQSFMSDLTSWKQQETADYVKAQRLQVPGPLQSAHAEALATFQLRYGSLDAIAGHLELAESKHDRASVAAAALASDAQLLSASDIVWEQLYKLAVTGILKAQNVTGVTVPASQIVTSPDIVSASSLAILYQRIRTPSQGGGATGAHYDNVLVGTSAVESGHSHPLSTTSGTTVFASTTSLVIDVVVEDSSNAPEVQVPVTLTVKAGTQSLYSQTRKVPVISAHGEATVSFSGIQVPVSALSHSASISVSIKKVHGEARLDNNSATYPVFFRLAPS